MGPFPVLRVRTEQNRTGHKESRNLSFNYLEPHAVRISGKGPFCLYATSLVRAALLLSSVLRIRTGTKCSNESTISEASSPPKGSGREGEKEGPFGGVQFTWRTAWLASSSVYVEGRKEGRLLKNIRTFQTRKGLLPSLPSPFFSFCSDIRHQFTREKTTEKERANSG